VSTGDASKELNALLKRLREQMPQALDASSGGNGAQGPTTLEPQSPLLGHLLRSFLLWESTTSKAQGALKRVEAAVVDFNELRHCMPDELVRLIGERYPRVSERALRLRTALNRIYAKEHAVCLERLTGVSKREAREYLDALDGVPRYVSARVALVCLGAHAAPVDSRIRRRLVEAKVIDAETSVDEAASVLERRVRAGEMPEVYALLQAWADEASFGPAESHLDGIKTAVKPVVDRAALEKKRREERRKAKRASLAKTKLKPKAKAGVSGGTKSGSKTRKAKD
jgi:endonuclease III